MIITTIMCFNQYKLHINEYSDPIGLRSPNTRLHACPQFVTSRHPSLAPHTCSSDAACVSFKSMTKAFAFHFPSTDITTAQPNNIKQPPSGRLSCRKCNNICCCNIYRNIYDIDTPKKYSQFHKQITAAMLAPMFTPTTNLLAVTRYI